MSEIFQFNRDIPRHLSVGACVYNHEGQIAANYFKAAPVPPKKNIHNDFYLLVRETPHMNESIEEAVLRGCKEELGVEGEVKHFLGSIESHFPYKKKTVQKTTIYFVVKCLRFDSTLRAKGAEERLSKVVWKRPAALLEAMRDQGRRFDRTDLDESAIIAQYDALYGHQS